MIPVTILIKPAGNPNMNESVRIDPPIIRPITEEKFIININSIKGNTINSAPNPIKVHPSTFVSSGRRFIFPDSKGIESNERIRIKPRMIFCTGKEKYETWGAVRRIRRMLKPDASTTAHPAQSIVFLFSSMSVVELILCYTTIKGSR
ncbi:MAG: hypothetical protein O8C61_01845 [Candidatus Methanoperedens sp.]|nr:hypothetical protein [Candidatus Methanoperedens sp.]